MKSPILITIAKELYQRIDASTDHSELTELGEVGRLLDPLYKAAGMPGLGQEFSLWAGLKIDTPDMGGKYGEGIISHYPELV